MAKTSIKVSFDGVSGNVFALAGTVSVALKRNGYRELSDEMYEKLNKCKSYDEALSLFQDYVEIV